MNRTYYIYLIEEEFATHYYGRESKMYQLFKDYLWKNNLFNFFQLIERQVYYITKPIPENQLKQLLTMQLSFRKEYSCVNNVHKLVLPGNRGSSTLILKDRHIELSTNGSYEAETIFFELLRKFDSCFLAMDFQNNRYGWLKPLKERNFV
ncbi:sporulation inhibitor of replication protein SirA [Bacillus lacus]|uniref:Sporulation inhibitor of replication protein SirA n=1 Tax=Metabacillus lacus TaxID=1983721 RepID=A0A7X2IVS6_9BACI|nr:sporulation inhibitor of replication protein SirA [Metabacillus lacus]MRX70697.1 sporulation inhibitor of replication protein SirA [Metabacillus lacus]